MLSHYKYNFLSIIIICIDDVVDHRQLNPGLGMVRAAAENLLSHPFLVLRRQCQV